MRHIEGQTFRGLRKISLNNHVMDPTTARENLSFAVYRAAGTPAPRTAYVELMLTVPGKHDNQLLGPYDKAPAATVTPGRYRPLVGNASIGTAARHR